MKKRTEGMITLEACVSVLTFLILMLLLSSLFVMFMAQNITSHTILQTTESLSVDTYYTEKLTAKEGSFGNVGDYAWKATNAVWQFVNGIFGVPDDNPDFVAMHRWYKEEDDKIVITDENAIKKKFVAYLAAGNETEADKLLKRVNIVNGLDGLDFTESYIDNGTLYVVLKYQMEYDFNIWDVGKVDVKQTTCSKLWK